jgi:hypothetical protein
LRPGRGEFRRQVIRQDLKKCDGRRQAMELMKAEVFERDAGG